MTKKVVYSILIGFFALITLTLIFLPIAVRKFAVKNSKEQIGRSISLEKIKINYFTSNIKLIDFKLYEADDSTKFVGFDTLIIDLEPYRLFNNELVIERLYIQGLDINISMYDSGFNFDDLIAFHQKDKIEGDSTLKDSEPLKFELSNFELKDALFTGKDVALGKQMELENINFFVPYLSWNQADKSEAGLRFDFKNGGYFQSKIDIDPAGGEFDAELTVNNLDISGYDEFVAKYINLGTFVGKTDLDLKVSGNIKNPEKTKISGAFDLLDFELKNGEKAIAGVRHLRVRLTEADPDQNRFLIDSVRLDSPYLYFEMYDSTNNIVELINRAIPPEDTLHAESKPENAEKTQGAPLYYSLNSFTIADGTVDLVDNRTGEPFKYHLSKLKVNTDSVTSTSDWVETHANMLLNDRGKLVADVGLNPKNPMNLTVDYTISDFMLSDLNIYSRHYMGFPILYGDMYYKAHTEISDGQLSSENKLIIYNVELGSKGTGLYDLPLKFALFLLKDKDGVITLDVPVRGDLKDPKVRVGRIVWNTFKNLIIKAAAAPVKLLAGLISGDPKDIESIEYAYLDTVFTEKRQKQLDLLLELEQKKPDLEIELIYLNDPELEKQEAALYEIGRQYEEKTNNSFLQDKAGFEAYVRTLAKSDSTDIRDVCLQLVDAYTRDSLVNIYYNKRVSDIRNYLQQANDSTEISVITERRDAPKNIGSMPVFEVKYGMKEEKLQ